jgi:hypothetical protein
LPYSGNGESNIVLQSILRGIVCRGKVVDICRPSEKVLIQLTIVLKKWEVDSVALRLMTIVGFVDKQQQLIEGDLHLVSDLNYLVTSSSE